MSETNNQNDFNKDIDQSLAMANEPRLQEEQQISNVLQFPDVPKELPQTETRQPAATEASEVAAPVEKPKLSGFQKLGLLGAGVLTAFGAHNAATPDKEVEKPVPAGFSNLSTPYELGSESIDGNKIDTTSEVALQVTKNIEGEQGGLDLVAEEINDRTKEFGYNNLDNTVWVPTNADANPEEPGMQLVPPEDKPQ